MGVGKPLNTRPDTQPLIAAAAAPRPQMADSLKDSPPAERVSRNPFKLLRKTVANPLVTYICFAGILLGMASHVSCTRAVGRRRGGASRPMQASWRRRAVD